MPSLAEGPSDVAGQPGLDAAAVAAGQPEPAPRRRHGRWRRSRPGRCPRATGGGSRRRRAGRAACAIRGRPSPGGRAPRRRRRTPRCPLSAVKVPLASTSPVMVVVSVGLRALPRTSTAQPGVTAMVTVPSIATAASSCERVSNNAKPAADRWCRAPPAGSRPGPPRDRRRRATRRRRRARRWPGRSAAADGGWAVAGAGPATTAAARAAAVTARLIAAGPRWRRRWWRRPAAPRRPSRRTPP